MGPLDPDTWQEIGDALRTNPVRTALTMAGVFWGTFVLVAMLGFSSGLEEATYRTLRGTVTNAVFIWGGRTRLAYAGLQPGRRVTYDNDDVEALSALPRVKVLAPRNQLGGWRDGVAVSRGSEAGAFTVMGDVPGYGQVMTVEWDHGRFLNELDLQESRKVAVIGKQVWEALWPDGGDPIGDHLRVRGSYFQVIGVFHSARGDDSGDRDEQTIHVPLTTFQRTFNVPNQVQWFAAVAEDDVSAAEIEAVIKERLMARHDVHPEDTQALGSYNAEEEFQRIRSLFAGIRGLTWLVGVATLMTGAVGVSNVLLIVVRERTKEIGVRRALGATPGSIVAMIVQEAVVMTGLAGVAGLVVGIGLVELGAVLIGPDNPSFGVPRVDPTAAGLAAVVLVLAGLVAGVLPARRAVAIQPVEALRAE